jgi:periplasmic protein TonB
MELLRDKNSRIGLFGTLLFHVLLLLLFLFNGLQTPNPIPIHSLAISFGNSNDGMGEIQPQDLNAAPKTSPQVEEQVNQTVTPTPTVTNTEAITQNTVDAISINDKKTTVKKTEPEPEKEPEKTVNQKALFPGKTNGQSSGSQGETGKAGDQGDPGGDKNSKSPVGNYTGGGDKYELGLRKAKVKPKPKYECQETGIVIVEIRVDQSGKTIGVRAGIQGTTNPASCLVKRAEEAAWNTTWEADPNANETQVGKIIYNFLLN